MRLYIVKTYMDDWFLSGEKEPWFDKEDGCWHSEIEHRIPQSLKPVFPFLKEMTPYELIEINPTPTEITEVNIVLSKRKF